MFDKVRQLTMCDDTPFERKLFHRISRDFPSLAFLQIINNKPMNNKDGQSTSIIFPYLTLLDLREGNLRMRYASLVMITKNFNSDPTDFNCKTLRSLDLDQAFVRQKNFQQYFPLL